MEIILPRPVEEEALAHLRAAYPNEGGGFLLGHRQDKQVTVLEVIPVANVFAAEEQYHRYAMRPEDWIALEDQAEGRGLTLVGYFHSHPDSPAVPSDYDRMHALPNFVYLIVQVDQGGVRAARVWQLVEDRSRFEELSLIRPGAGDSLLTH
ncbi:MAG: M67 family metallopeptidase [Anaerolineae bacterium]|nr:M67 family metallopeptidase [Anaerolineae bacterium]